jgi:hypothetical protein
MSKLEQFILFHLFKAPALLLSVAVACVVAAGALQHETRQIQGLMQSRTKLDMELIEYNGHFLATNASVESVLSAFQIPCRTLTSHPVQLELDYDAAKKLERVGLLVSAAEFENGRLTVTLKDYPEAK